MIIDGRYRVLETIAETPAGSVYLTEHELIRRRLVVKVLGADAARHPSAVTRFVDEAEAAGRLRHPNIVESVDLGFVGERPYVVLEHLQGSPLSEELARIGRLPVRRAVHVARQAAAALHAAHLEGLLAAALDADHVYLVDRETDPDFVKVLGLGRGARDVDPELQSPEQIVGTELDPRTDVWAIGVLIYEMLTGRRPFSADAGAATARRRIVGAEPALIDRHDVGPALAAVVLTCLAKAPDGRYQDMSELDQALAPFDVRVARGSSTTIPPLPSLGRPRRPSSPHAATASPARPSVRLPAELAPRTPSHASISGLLPLASAHAGGSSRTPAPTQVVPRMAARHARLLAAGGVVGIALCAVGIWITLRGPAAAEEPPGNAAAAAPTAGAGAAPIAPPELVAQPGTTVPRPDPIAVEIDADAPGARVTFRRRIAAAPLVVEATPGDMVELVEVTAPGRKTVRFWLTFDRTTHLRATLPAGAGLVEATEAETLVALGEVDPTVVPAKAAANADARATPPARPRPVKRAIGRAPEVAEAAPAAPAPPPTTPAPEAATAPSPDELPTGAAFAVRDPSAGAPLPRRAPRTVPAGLLEASRIAGNAQILPDNATRQAMHHSGTVKATGTFRLCASADGSVASVTLTRSSGFSGYDRKIADELRGWRFKPIAVDGEATGVCASVTIAYRQQ